MYFKHFTHDSGMWDEHQDTEYKSRKYNNFVKILDFENIAS